MITTKRLMFRAIEETDLELIRNWRFSEDMCRYFPDNEPINMFNQKKWFENVVSNFDENKFFLVVKLDDNTPIGLVLLQKLDLRNGNAESAIYLGDAEYYSKGYATEMQLTILDYAFNYLNLHKVYAEILEGNERSLSLHKKFNFKVTGTFKEHIYHEGRHIDLIRLEVLKNEFLDVIPKINSLCERMKGSE